MVYLHPFSQFSSRSDRLSVVSSKLACIICAMIALTGCVTTTFEGEESFDRQRAVDANIALGMSYLKADNRESALRSFNKALKLDSKSVKAYQGMAMIHERSKEYSLAEKRYLESIKYADGELLEDVRVDYARMLKQNGQCKKALPVFDSVAANVNYPKRYVALYLKGMCLLSQGEGELGQAALSYAFSVNPKFTPSAIELAELAIAEKDYAAAKRYIDAHDRYASASARSLWYNIQIERIFDNMDRAASLGLQLEDRFPYSNETLMYKQSLKR